MSATFASPDFKSYDLIVINTSAGKDSQAMMDHVVALVRAAGQEHKLVAVHCDLGRVEWAGTRELAEEQAKHYGLRLEVVSRAQDLLSQVEKRGMWPSSTARYCTSDHKRAQVYKLFTRLVAEVQTTVGKRQVRILNCMGLRAEESSARAQKPVFAFDKMASNGKRHVDTWLPIHNWIEARVWDVIRRSGVRHHVAYDLGMPRLSCVFCIFAPKDALVIAGHHNAALLAEYVRVERAIDHTFRTDTTLVQIQAAVAAGVMPERGRIEWRQCA